jgi:hypothetical protein
MGPRSTVSLAQHPHPPTLTVCVALHRSVGIPSVERVSLVTDPDGYARGSLATLIPAISG